MLATTDEATELVANPWLVLRMTLNSHQRQMVIDQFHNRPVELLRHLVARIQAIQRSPVSIDDGFAQ